MKIANVIVGTESGGVATVWATVTRGLVARGVEVDVLALTSGGPLLDQLRHVGADVRSVDGYRLINQPSQGSIHKMLWMLRRLAVQFRSAPSLRSALRERSYDCVLIQSPQELLVTALVARSVGVGVIWMMPQVMRDAYGGLNRIFFRSIVRYFGVVALPNSRATSNSLGGDAVGRRIMHLGVKLDAFEREQSKAAGERFREQLGIRHGKVLGVVGRVEEGKGQAVLMKALGTLRCAEHMEMSVIFCGPIEDLEYKRRLDSLAAEHGLSDRVHYTGMVEDVRAVVSAMDLVVSASLVVESFGLSLVEAMALEKPVIAPAQGGPLDIVTDDCGWLWNSAAGLADTLEECLAGAERWGEMGQAGRKRVENEFTEERMMTLLLDAVEQQRTRFACG